MFHLLNYFLQFLTVIRSQLLISYTDNYLAWFLPKQPLCRPKSFLLFPSATRTGYYKEMKSVLGESVSFGMETKLFCDRLKSHFSSQLLDSSFVL